MFSYNRIPGSCIYEIGIIIEFEAIIGLAGEKGIIMATSIEYIEYICEQIKNTGAVRYRKMFGEYMVYVDEKPILTVCDNTVFVKMLPDIQELMKQADTGYPYEGAKEHYVLDIDNEELTTKVVEVLKSVIPVRKKK